MKGGSLLDVLGAGAGAAAGAAGLPGMDQIKQAVISQVKTELVTQLNKNSTFITLKEVAQNIPTLTTKLTDLPNTIKEQVRDTVRTTVQEELAKGGVPNENEPTGDENVPTENEPTGDENVPTENEPMSGGGLERGGKIEVVQLNTHIKEPLYVFYDDNNPIYFTYNGNKMTVIPLSKVLKQRSTRHKRLAKRRTKRNK